MAGSARVFAAQYASHAALALILLLAAYLRLEGLGASSLWLDECYTAQFSQYGISDVVKTCWGDVHPPLFFFIANGVMKLSGKSEFFLRLPSALFGVAACLATFLLARMLVGRRFALLAALLMAVCPLAIDHSREARSYPLAMFIGTMLTVAMLRLCESPTRRRVITVVLWGALLAYTHYVGLIYLFSLVSASLLLSGFSSEAKRSVAKASLLVLILFSPWIPVFIGQLGGKQPHIGRFSLISLRDVFWAHGPLSAIRNEGLSCLAGALFLSFVVLSVIRSILPPGSSSPPRDAHFQSMVRCLSGTLIFFAAVYYLLGFWRPSFLSKMALVVYPVLMSLFAVGVAAIVEARKGRGYRRATSSAIALVTLALALASAAEYRPPVHPDIRSLFEFLKQRPASEPLLLCRNDAAPMADFYLPNAAGMFHSGRMFFLPDVDAVSAKLDTLRRSERLWVVSTSPGKTPLEDLAERQLKRLDVAEFDRCYAILYTWPDNQK